jgi:hypothetical protein
MSKTTKLKNEAELVKLAIEEGVAYAEERGVAQFEATDSHNLKIEYIYRLLVHDQLIQPLAKDQISLAAYKHKLALWIHKKIPDNHPLK